ncbi:hypothetical protein E4K10_46895 [Streptomyces sp. T1317-0309]|nr:hypothetical protein E4K10_46895 [Streptomyces sp. T1317-0309]
MAWVILNASATNWEMAGNGPAVHPAGEGADGRPRVAELAVVDEQMGYVAVCTSASAPEW